MSFFVSKNVQRKIWTSAFIVVFVISAIAIAFLRVTNQDVMMNAGELNWYYMLYLAGSMAVVLGIINLWMYRKALLTIFFEDGADDEEEG
jgi:hypothetical protein